MKSKSKQKFLNLIKVMIITFVVLGLMPIFYTSSRVEAATATEPIVNLSDLQYIGAFRLPAGTYGSANGFSFGGSSMAYNPTNNSLFVGGYDQKVAEVNIPTPVNSPDINVLPFASVRQNFFDPTEGNLIGNPNGGTAIPSGLGGLLVDSGKLIGSGYIYYDANNGTRVSHYTRSKDLSSASFSGWYTLWDSLKEGMVGKYMASVPSEWQTSLGGTAIAGMCCTPIIFRTSTGPSAIAFDPNNLTGPVYPSQTTPVSASPLLYYTNNQNATLGRWEGSNTVYGGTTDVGGLAIIAGTRSALFFGRNGTGPFCYGEGGATNPDNAPSWCYDPAISSKGQHSYPYNKQIWAYDLNDWAAVKAGTKNPWEVLPYATWNIEFPITGSPTNVLSSVAYDSTRQLIYVSQASADQDTYAYRPLIQVYKVNVGTAINTPPGAVISAYPNSINAGSSTTLSWSTSKADSVTIDHGIGTVAATGSIVVSPSVTTKYTITTSNAYGTNTQNVSVQVVGAASTTTASIGASPLSITSGASSTLTWSTSNATSVSINQGIGTVAGSGSLTVNPSVTTTYTITATGTSGTVASAVTVTVTSPPVSNPITGDINSDHIVNSVDYSILNSKWFTTDTSSDLNKDGLVNAIDFSLLNANWLKTW